MRKLVDTVMRLLLFVVVFLLMQIVSIYIVKHLPLGGDASLQQLVTYSCSMLLTLIALNLCQRWVVPSERNIMKKISGLNPIVTLMGVVVLIALSIVVNPLEQYMPADRRIFDDSAWTLITVVFLAPIFEEIIFRNQLYNILRSNCSPLVAVLLSSLVFSAIHLEPVVLISGVVSGIVFSYAYLRTRSIFAPIILHMCNNALAYALTILSYNERSLLELVDSDAYSLIIYIVSSVIVLAAMTIMTIRISRFK